MKRQVKNIWHLGIVSGSMKKKMQIEKKCLKSLSTLKK